MAAVQGPSPFSTGSNVAPGSTAWLLTPSDTVNEDSMFRAIFVGSAGDIALVPSVPNNSLAADAAVLLSNCLAGSIIPIMGVRVNVTNTTASLLVGII